MIPPTIHSSVRSGAERRLFRVIESAYKTDGWTCLHSLALARHDTKRRAEIDFLLLTPLGLFVLEVKGGRLRREAGVWIHTDRFGVSYRKSESPFDQAAGAMFALEKDLKSEFIGDPIANALLGYGVIFPDVEYQSVGSEADARLVYDARDRHRPFAEYVQGLANFSRERELRPRRLLSGEQLARIAQYLRGDFDLVPLIDVEIGDTVKQLAKLTREQFAVLDTAETKPRLLIDGPAGSGKTLLAIEAARRDARQGKKVLLLCYNRFLALRIRAQLENEAFHGSVSVVTLYAHFLRVINRSSLAEEFGERSKQVTTTLLYGEVFPEFAAMAAIESDESPFDAMVVDEAQDVLTSVNIGALSEMVLGGLEGGRWRFFLDVNEQACVYGRMDPGVLARVGRASIRLLLTVNCRNTKPIVIQTNIVADPATKTVGRIEGAPVQFFSYKDERQCLGKLEEVLNILRSERMPPGRVSVLFTHSPSDEKIRKLARMGVRQLSEMDVLGLMTDRLTEFTWASVSGFKGLENDVVVLVGVEDIESDWSRAVTYVGMSRARVRLYVITDVACESVRHERFEKELKRQMAIDGNGQ